MPRGIANHCLGRYIWERQDCNVDRENMVRTSSNVAQSGSYNMAIDCRESDVFLLSRELAVRTASLYSSAIPNLELKCLLGYLSCIAHSIGDFEPKELRIVLDHCSRAKSIAGSTASRAFVVITAIQRLKASQRRTKSILLSKSGSKSTASWQKDIPLGNSGSSETT